MVRKKQANDELWLELLNRSLEDLESVRLVAEDSESVTALKQAIENKVAELESRENREARPTRSSSKRENVDGLVPPAAQHLRILQVSTCILPAKGLVRRSRQLLASSRQRVARLKMRLHG